MSDITSYLLKRDEIILQKKQYYNNGKWHQSVKDATMISYAIMLRKWYWKLAFYLFEISIINAHIVYQAKTNKKIKILEFI